MVFAKNISHIFSESKEKFELSAQFFLLIPRWAHQHILFVHLLFLFHMLCLRISSEFRRIKRIFKPLISKSPPGCMKFQQFYYRTIFPKFSLLSLVSIKFLMAVVFSQTAGKALTRSLSLKMVQNLFTQTIVQSQYFLHSVRW